MTDLPTNALRLDFERARDESANAWTRAKDGDVDHVNTGDVDGEFDVQFDDGESHDVVLVEDRAGYVGACDCDSFSFHGQGERLVGNVCAHLCLVRQMGVLDESLIPTVDEDLDVVDRDEMDVDVVDHTGDDRPDAGDGDQEASADPPTRPDQADAPTPRDSGATRELDDPFADSLEDVDERFVMTLGGDPYIRREGFQRLARREGYRVRSEMRTWASDTDCKLAEASAKVLDEDGDVVATGTGTAYLPQEDLSGAKSNLNELAETRAISRAMGWATGAGLSAVEVDASAEFDEDREAVTDGGR